MFGKRLATGLGLSQGVLVVLVAAVCAANGQSKPVKPLSGLRDYNGTYAGSVGTGSIGYGGTLYRDNQDNGQTAGCRGEGCGRHPGVDIPVPSGTSVYAALSGSVVISRCDPAWGGLVVIRAQHPARSYEFVFVVYGHMRSRKYGNGLDVLVGDGVGAGVKIGQSGGGASDPCAGSSTGSHLHFQVDKDDGNPEPFFPSKSLLNTCDDDFSVAARTYNPAVFITGRYHWKFGQTGNRELWDIFNFQSWGVSDDALWVDAGNDPYIRRGGLTSCGLAKPCSSNISAEATDYQQVYFDMVNQCVGSSGKIYFTTSTEPRWDENKTVPFFPGQGAYQARVWMGRNSRWKGIITGLRIDPAESCSPYIWDPTYYGEIALQR